MLLSVTIAAAVAVGTIGGKDRSYWTECADGMHTTLVRAVASRISGVDDNTRQVRGMDAATACTQQALHLPQAERQKYQAMLMAFMSGLEKQTRMAVDEFEPTQAEFVAALPGAAAAEADAMPIADDELIATAKQKIERQLRDPGSAQYRDVTVRRARLPMVCGEVNAKNAYGGYVGFRRFMVTEKTTLLENLSGSPQVVAAERQLFDSLCPPVN